jgi:hypothetical protein
MYFTAERSQNDEILVVTFRILGDFTVLRVREGSLLNTENYRENISRSNCDAVISL